MTTKTKLKQGQKYLFEWNDTYGNHGWFDDEEIRKNTLTVVQQSSVGFFVQEIGDWYILATHKNEHRTFPRWGDVSWIPKGAIKKIIFLG